MPTAKKRPIKKKKRAPLHSPRLGLAPKPARPIKKQQLKEGTVLGTLERFPQFQLRAQLLPRVRWPSGVQRFVKRCEFVNAHDLDLDRVAAAVFINDEWFLWSRVERTRVTSRPAQPLIREFDLEPVRMSIAVTITRVALVFDGMVVTDKKFNDMVTNDTMTVHFNLETGFEQEPL